MLNNGFLLNYKEPRAGLPGQEDLHPPGFICSSRGSQTSVQGLRAPYQGRNTIVKFTTQPAYALFDGRLKTLHSVPATWMDTLSL